MLLCSNQEKRRIWKGSIQVSVQFTKHRAYHPRSYVNYFRLVEKGGRAEADFHKVHSCSIVFYMIFFIVTWRITDHLGDASRCIVCGVSYRIIHPSECSSSWNNPFWILGPFWVKSRGRRDRLIRCKMVHNRKWIRYCSLKPKRRTTNLYRRFSLSFEYPNKKLDIINSNILKSL